MVGVWELGQQPVCGWVSCSAMTALADRLLPEPLWQRIQPLFATPGGIKVRIGRRGVESSTRLGRHRWKAERTIAWLAGCRRLRIRYDRDSERALSS